MKKPVRPKKTLRVCFDIETELFSEQFRNARDVETRLRHAPRMRVACAFDEMTWHFFLPSEFDKLVKLLLAADEVISFNGLQFDELILRKHCKLEGKLPSKGLHVDLCHEISLTHHSVSLHRLSLLNLNEGKHTAGRSIAALDIEALKVACKSDVWQTYRLWDLWRKGMIKVPAPRAIKDGEDFVGPGHHMPALCPSCHSANSLELIDEDPEEMSEGQASDYLAGMFGCAVCCACGAEIDWEV
ncbi:MAG: hypothetical protein ABSG88_11925 [Bradyrhizobium sp.]